MNTKKWCANPDIILREESDEHSLLFNPDTGDTYILNPVSTMTWKLLDGHHTTRDIQDHLALQCTRVPDSIQEDITAFINELLQKGMVLDK